MLSANRFLRRILLAKIHLLHLNVTIFFSRLKDDVEFHLSSELYNVISSRL